MNRSGMLFVVTSTFLLLLDSSKTIAQASNFGSATKMVFSSSSGEINKTGLFQVRLNIGTNLGTVTDFGRQYNLSGIVYNTNKITIQASSHLIPANNQLHHSITKKSGYAPVFGNSEINSKVVYTLLSASTDDGMSNPGTLGMISKRIVFQFNEEPKTCASTSINLLNNAINSNDLSIAKGAIEMAVSTSMANRLIAHNAANSTGTIGVVNGSMYLTPGAIAVNNNTVAFSLCKKAAVPYCTDNPVINHKPYAIEIYSGQAHTFNSINAGKDLSYEWIKNDSDLSNQITANYAITIATLKDTGLYAGLVIGSFTPLAIAAADTLIVPIPNINLGSTEKFLLFTSVGAVSNAGVSQLTGDIGTYKGAITGFETSTVNGNFHNSDSVAALCVKDLQNLYDQLNSTPATNISHAAVFGNGEVILPGVYSIAGAGSVSGSLILDAKGDKNKVFIFKVGGTFTTGASAAINLINGATSCNIFWVVEGAIAMAPLTNMQGTLIAHNAAISMATGGKLNGRLLSTAGGVLIENINGAISTGCLQETRWTGAVSTDWFNSSNWFYGLIPADTINITIPAGLTNYPVVTAGKAYAGNITIQNMASITVVNGNLSIKGTIINKGSFDATAGTITFSGNTLQTITANTFVNNTVQFLIIANDVALGGALNNTGSISFIANNKTFTTNDFLTIKSNAIATGGINDLTNGGTLSGNNLTGNVSSELYISKQRAWRLLSGQLMTPNPLTINSSWQEGSTSNNPAPGYGTQITGGAATYGFDHGINNNAAIKIYDTTKKMLIGLPLNPGTNIPVTNNVGYFIFIRGDRSTNLSLGVNAPVTPTTLRVKGPVNIGNIMQPVNATNFSLVSNPYLQSINFHTLTKQNVADMFYIWDPKLTGQSGVGGYVTFVYNAVSQSYDATASVSAVSQYIAYGEAFYVSSIDGIRNGLLTFKETDKSTAGSKLVYRSSNKNPTLRVDLISINDDRTKIIIDGILTTFDNLNKNTVDKDDARKMFNPEENISIVRDNINLAVERRKTIMVNDTCFIQLDNLKKRSYQLSINTKDLDKDNLMAELVDNYQTSNNHKILNIKGSLAVAFYVNADSASFARNRFSIILKKVNDLSLGLTSLKAIKYDSDILVQWTSENEDYLKAYEVQQSSNKIIFTKAATLLPGINNMGKENFIWKDAAAAEKEGTHYYRLKATNINGDTTYSKIVKIKIENSYKIKRIVLIGNPIKENAIKFRLENISAGFYNLDLYNMEGKLVKRGSVLIGAGNAAQNFIIGNGIPAGSYNLILSDKTTKISTTIEKL